MSSNPLEIITIGETAKYLRIYQSSLYKLAQDGRIPCQKVGWHWRFRMEAIDRWLKQMFVHTDNKPTGEQQGA